jgi:two-component system chemotaxis response regulator CheB
MIVDDSAVVRGMLQRWLEVERDIAIVAVATNGRDGVRLAAEKKPDIIILDVEMPELDGLSAIPQLLQVAPQARILMASTLTHRNAETTLKALSLGAADYTPKPEAGKLAGAADFKRDILGKIRALGARRSARPSMAMRAQTPPAIARTPLKPLAHLPEVIVIGSSTGGPQALAKVISVIGAQARQPILITQHMPAMFTAILADHLAKLTRAPTAEAKDGMPIKAGSIYIAPGDFHMRIQRKHGAPIIALDQTPPVNFCRPAVDPLFASAAEIFGPAVLACVLTGMGQDGKKGAEAIKAKGGAVIVQDESSSVVWGMPGAVANAGLAAAIKPLDEIGHTLLALSQGKS